MYSHKSKFISCHSYSILEIIFYTHFIETKGDVQQNVQNVTMRNDDSNFIIIKHRMGNIKNDPLTSKTTNPFLQYTDRHTHAEEEHTERDPHTYRPRSIPASNLLISTDMNTDRSHELSVIRQQQSKADQRTAFSFHRVSGLAACYCVENRAEMTAEETRRN